MFCGGIVSTSPPVNDPLVLRIGRGIDVLGQAMLPMSIGGLAGFYLADQGIKFIPSALELMIAWSIVALALIAIGRYIIGRLYKVTPQGVKLRRRNIAVFALMILGMGIKVVIHSLEKPSDLTLMDPIEFEVAFEQDAKTYLQNDNGLDRLIEILEQSSITKPGSVTTLDVDDEILLLEVFQSFMDYSLSQDSIRAFYEDYYRFDPSRIERSYHLRSFLLTFAAELSLYEKASRFTKLVLQNQNAMRFLDAPHEGSKVPPFSQLREQLLGTRDQSRILAGQQYLVALEKGLGGRKDARLAGVDWLWKSVEAHLDIINAIAPIDRASLTVRADTQILKRSIRRVWFPVQKETAEKMGDFRVRRIGWYLIPEEQQKEAQTKLLPGDILMARKNWYMSNVGLPGFWPHAILYIGSLASL